MADDFMSGYALGQNEGSKNGGGGFMDGNGSWVWILVIFALLFGWGGNGSFGNNGGGGAVPYISGIATRADINEGFALNGITTGITAIQQGICDSTYALNNAIQGGFNATQMGMMQGFNGVERGFCDLSHQLSDCCCTTQNSILTSTNALQRQISDCCCDLEKMNMQNRFDNQSNHCGTLQAIDKLGDRIIGYMVNADTQRLRDENQALRLSASQAAQNAYLIGQLRPSPIPSYRVPNPYCCNNNPCDCNGGW